MRKLISVVTAMNPFALALAALLAGAQAILPLSALLVALPAGATGLDLGINRNYAFVDLGNTTLGWNSGPIAGSVLFGQGLTANLSGGNNGGLTNGGTVDHDSTATISGSLQNPVTLVLVPGTTTQSALTSAMAVSAYASSLGATQTFTNINNTTTITGNGGLNVIDVANISNAPLTLSGNANDIFVFNVTGAINTNQAMTLSGGVTAAHVLFNLTGTSGNVFQTSGGDVSYGTYLATNGGQFQFSNLNLTGALINTGGNVQFVSGAKIPTFVGFVPEPTTLALMVVGLAGLGVIGRRRGVSLSQEPS
jgi:hypothetical protein